MERVLRFLVLGGPVPARLREDLGGSVSLHAEAELPFGEADGILLHAVADLLPALRRFRAAGGALPLFGWSDTVADVRDRLAWIREGADDLVSGPHAADALNRRLRGRPAGRIAEPAAAARIDRYLRTIERYVQAREQLVAGMGDGGRGRIVDCSFLRDQVIRAAEDSPADAFGQRRGSERESLGWPVELLEPAGKAELINIGADGVCLALFQAPSREGHLRAAVEGLSVRAELDLEVRWHRRAGRDRWEAGALSVGCRLVRGA